MTKSLTINKMEKEIPKNYEVTPRFFDYVKLMGQFFEVKYAWFGVLPFDSL